MTVLLGLCSAFGFAVADLWNVRITRGADQVVALLWLLGTGLVVSLPLALLVDGWPRSSEWGSVALAALGGLLYLVGLAGLLLALRRGDLSVVAPITSLEGGFGAALAVAAGERMTVLLAVALTLGVVGAALASAEPGRASARGAGWAALAAGSFGTSFVIFGEAGEVSALTVVAVARLAAVAVLIPLLMIGERPAMPARLRLVALASGCLDGLAFLALAAALALGPVAVASVLVAQFATFAVLLGLIVLRERPALRQLVGIALALVAATLLAAT